MNSVENHVQAAMSAAQNLAARKIPAAPPLHLPPSPATVPSGGHAPRRWIRWSIPLAAAAAIIAVAGSLVIVKGIQNGGTVSANPGSTSTGQAAPTGPDGVPRYYAALSTFGESVDKPLRIVVGDAVTGKTLATFAPPKDTRFTSVTAAADDRSFVVSAVTSSDGASLASAKGTVTGSWYAVQLAPGTANPVRLTPLPIAPQPADQSALLSAFNAALSSSGQELAVAEYTARTGMAVKVFSVTTGQLLHDWTFNDPSLPPPPKNRGTHFSGAAFRLPTMTWIDGDQALALETPDLTHLGQITPYEQTVRELDVAGSASGDLLTDSKVSWAGPTVGYPADLVQSPAEVLEECTESPGSDLVISAGGKTFSCAAQQPTDGYTQSYRTYPLTLNTTAAENGTLDYQMTHAEAKGLDTPMVLWASPAGDTMIAAWNTMAKGAITDTADGLHVGVISHGMFTPLRFPPAFTLISGENSLIAW
jgi:hypothetical protein